MFLVFELSVKLGFGPLFSDWWWILSLFQFCVYKKISSFQKSPGHKTQTFSWKFTPIIDFSASKASKLNYKPCSEHTEETEYKLKHTRGLKTLHTLIIHYHSQLHIHETYTKKPFSTKEHSLFAFQAQKEDKVNHSFHNASWYSDFDTHEKLKTQILLFFQNFSGFFFLLQRN